MKAFCRREIQWISHSFDEADKLVDLGIPPAVITGAPEQRTTQAADKVHFFLTTQSKTLELQFHLQGITDAYISSRNTKIFVIIVFFKLRLNSQEFN